MEEQMTITLTTAEPNAPHEVIDIIGAIGTANKQMFTRGPFLGDALKACKMFLREKAEELGADAVVATRFETTYNHETINIVGYGTAIRWL